MAEKNLNVPIVKKPKKKFWEDIFYPEAPSREHPRPESYQKLWDPVKDIESRRKTSRRADDIEWEKGNRKQKEQWMRSLSENPSWDDEYKSAIMMGLYPQLFFFRDDYGNRILPSKEEVKRISKTFTTEADRQRPRPISRLSKLADELLPSKFDYPAKDHPSIAQGQRIVAAKKALKDYVIEHTDKDEQEAQRMYDMIKFIK